MRTLTPNRGRAARRGLALLLGAACLAAACAANPERARIDLAVGPASYQVELALTEQEQQTGLMFRQKLGERQGMLFCFPYDDHRSFWMKNTLVPLSIAYISSQGVITEILDMEPQSLASVRSAFAVRYALEVPQGSFGRNGVKVGDRVVLPKLPGD